MGWLDAVVEVLDDEVEVVDDSVVDLAVQPLRIKIPIRAIASDNTKSFFTISSLLPLLFKWTYLVKVEIVFPASFTNYKSSISLNQSWKTMILFVLKGNKTIFSFLKFG